MNLAANPSLDQAAAMRGPEQGFSVVEALIALAIIAAMTLTLFAAITANARARMMVRERRMALILAQSRLDDTVDGQSETQGQWADLVWQVDRESYGNSASFSRNRLELVTVTVEDTKHNQLARLSTVRFVP